MTKTGFFKWSEAQDRRCEFGGFQPIAMTRGDFGHSRLVRIEHLHGVPAFMRRLISSGSSYETDIGYSRAVVDGDWIFVSGTTGFDYDTMTISADVREQAKQTMKNIEWALAEAGSSLAAVVRVRYIFPDAADFKPCWPVLRQHFGEVRPAATMISAGLADPRMKIEIEVTARRVTGAGEQAPPG